MPCWPIYVCMQNGTADKIKNVVPANFALEDIIAAKDALWNACDITVIGEKKRRRDGQHKKEGDSHTNDIINALQILDARDMMPDIVISFKDLGTIPRSHPEELNDISLADRLNQLETKLSSVIDTVDTCVASNLALKEEFVELKQHKGTRATYASIACGGSV